MIHLSSRRDCCPLITIGITCYNAKETILRAIRSALAQDWENYELVIVDDCSPDDSADIIENAIQDSANARLIRHATNRGPAAARNSILDAARGEFIAFFDDDDESRPDRIRIQLETLRSYETNSGADLVACYASGRRCYPNGYELHVEAVGARPAIPKGEVIANYLLFNGRVPGVCYGGGTPTCALMARRSTIQVVGGFDEGLRRVEDVDFAIRLALAGGHFIGCRQELYIQYATVAPDKSPLMNLQAELQLVDKYEDYLKRKRRYSYARAWFRIRYYHFSGQRLKFMASLIAHICRFPIAGLKHLLRSAPSRWTHERSMQRNRKEVP